MIGRRRARRALSRRLDRPAAGPDATPAPPHSDATGGRPSLLDEAELAMDERGERGAPAPIEEEDEATEEHAREALGILEPPEPSSEEALDAESLEANIEQSWEPADTTLHEEESLTSALLDEGEPLPEGDADSLEAEIEARDELEEPGGETA